ncbi:MAG: ABC transporter permease, partial [Lentisphaeria bacterium]|nr:ABC transporter permease [Lentisphaeria bacterium]
YRWVIFLNPMTPVIVNTRTIFFKPMAPNWTLVGASWLTGVVIFQLGFCIFMRLRRRFADVV